MLTGSYFNTIDVKGRVVIPTKLRYSLGERIWLVRGIDPCLYIFTQKEWDEYTNKYINNRSMTDAKARKLQRFTLGGSHELDIDRQGRINLPQNLIDYAGIDKDVVFIGCPNRIEVWSAEAYEEDMSPENLDPDELMKDASGAASED